ncbi:MAG: TetR/AcrR family transcriptional regulator [Syntrophales bacterium]
MRTEKLNTEVRQEQIAQAALGLVGSQGMKGLSMGGLARRLGLVPSALYRHFRSKEQVIDAILELLRNRLLENVATVCQETSEPLERLRRLLMLHVKLIRENQGLIRVFFSEEVHHGHPQRKARVYKTIKGYLDALAEIVHQGQQEGAIRSDVDPGTIAVMFLGLIQPGAILWHLSEGKFDVTKQAERSWKIFCATIMAEKLAAG